MFRLVNVNGRAALERDGRWYDLAELSGDATFADPLAAVARHRELHALNERCRCRDRRRTRSPRPSLGAPIPRPRQVFGIGLNYRDHAGESDVPLPPAPLTFTKFPSCIAGPTADVPLSGDMVDWEVEIVAVIGDETTNVGVADAWSVVAGLTLGQDISDRAVQMTGVPPQFCLGKSFANYGPTGPALVSTDAFDDPDDIGLWCDVAGERMQAARTTELIFSIPTLVAYLSSICPLYPGDLIFTGTPSGVGMARGRYLAPGETIVSGADVIGELRNTCRSGGAPGTVEHERRATDQRRRGTAHDTVETISTDVLIVEPDPAGSDRAAALLARPGPVAHGHEVREHRELAAGARHEPTHRRDLPRSRHRAARSWPRHAAP